MRDGGPVLSLARTLQAVAGTGAARPLLSGKKLGLICTAEGGPDALLFRRAAEALGAQVASLRPGQFEASRPADLQRAARLLGRLYDAVECQGMAPDIVRAIEREAGVPVYDGVATPAHPSAALAERLGGAGSGNECRCYILQAVLLGALS